MPVREQPARARARAPAQARTAGERCAAARTCVTRGQRARRGARPCMCRHRASGAHPQRVLGRRRVGAPGRCPSCRQARGSGAWQGHTQSSVGTPDGTPIADHTRVAGAEGLALAAHRSVRVGRSHLASLRAFHCVGVNACKADLEEVKRRRRCRARTQASPGGRPAPAPPRCSDVRQAEPRRGVDGAGPAGAGPPCTRWWWPRGARGQGSGSEWQWGCMACMAHDSAPCMRHAMWRQRSDQASPCGVQRAMHKGARNALVLNGGCSVVLGAQPAPWGKPTSRPPASNRTTGTTGAPRRRHPHHGWDLGHPRSAAAARCLPRMLWRRPHASPCCHAQKATLLASASLHPTKLSIEASWTCSASTGGAAALGLGCPRGRSAREFFPGFSAKP
jgi:hypothetical protein